MILGRILKNKFYLKNFWLLHHLDFTMENYDKIKESSTFASMPIRSSSVVFLNRAREIGLTEERYSTDVENDSLKPPLKTIVCWRKKDKILGSIDDWRKNFKKIDFK